MFGLSFVIMRIFHFFTLGFALGAVSGVRLRLKTLFRNDCAAIKADSVFGIFDSLKCLVDHFQNVDFISQKTKLEIMPEVSLPRSAMCVAIPARSPAESFLEERASST